MPASSAALTKASRSSNSVASGRLPCSTWSKSPIFINASARSVDFRLGNLSFAGEEIEIAALVGLSDVVGEHGAVAADVARRGLFPGRAAAVEFLLGDVQMDPARRHVHLDGIAR